MKVLIIGATGATGRELVAQGLQLGHQVTAVVRRPDEAGLPTEATVVKGDVKDSSSMAQAIRGQDVVVSSLGSKLSRKPTTLFSDGTRNLLMAMKSNGVRRLICITGVGAGDSRGHGGFLYDRILQPLLLQEIYRDKDRQEAIVRESAADWTLVRPGALTNGPRKGKIKVFTDMTGVTLGSISRADVAAFILEHLNDPQSIRKTYNLTY